MALEKLHISQIKKVLDQKMNAILDNSSLGDDTGNRLVHKKSDTLQSVFKHTNQIVCAAMKNNTHMTQFDLATFLGVK